jgi:transcriptional regulator with XRE-family HTH domain
MDSCIDGEHLKKMIKQAGYTIKEFYQELGVAKSTFYYYRTGERPIPRELRRRIEELLQCPFHDFLLKNQETNLILLPLEQQRHSSQQ